MTEFYIEVKKDGSDVIYTVYSEHDEVCYVSTSRLLAEEKLKEYQLEEFNQK